MFKVTAGGQHVSRHGIGGQVGMDTPHARSAAGQNRVLGQRTQSSGFLQIVVFGDEVNKAVKFLDSFKATELSEGLPFERWAHGV